MNALESRLERDGFSKLPPERFLRFDQRVRIGVVAFDFNGPDGTYSAIHYAGLHSGVVGKQYGRISVVNGRIYGIQERVVGSKPNPPRLDIWTKGTVAACLLTWGNSDLPVVQDCSGDIRY